VLLAFVQGLFYAATMLNAVALAHFVKRAHRGTCAQVTFWFIVALCCSFLACVLLGPMVAAGLRLGTLHKSSGRLPTWGSTPAKL
jgi:hypothetical protein